MKIETSI